jgi:pimeloyl-ACP methyl ester carboxylesterase
MSVATVETVEVADGHRVAVHRVAKGGGRTIVLCHPAPGSGLFDPGPDATAARDVTLLGVDRPGYGDSEPLGRDRWATVAGAADDLATVLDAMGIREVGVVGWSAGGRVALALAARRPDLVDRVAVVATPAPDDAVPWIPAEFGGALDAMRGLPAVDVHTNLEAQLAAMLAAAEAVDAAAALELLGSSEGDRPAFAMPGAQDRVTSMLEHGLRQGARGLAADIAGYCLQPWGFEPSEVQAKTLLLYGSADAVAGPRHGSWWQTALPNARLEVAPGAGHLVIVPMWPRVLSFLAPSRRTPTR